MLTEELAGLSKPSAELAMRDEMAAGIAQFVDAQFVDPTVSEVPNVNPGSITAGTTAIASAGPSAANAATDLSALTRQFIAAHPDAQSVVLLMNVANAMVFASTGNYADLRVTAEGGGGFVAGIPTIVSQSVGDRLIMLDPTQILFADDDDVSITVSRQATVQLDSTPTNPTDAATVLVSLWQRGLVGLRVDSRHCVEAWSALSSQIRQRCQLCVSA